LSAPGPSTSTHPPTHPPTTPTLPTTGYKHHLPRQSAWFGVFMFGTAALAHTTQKVAARLLGVLENDAEVKAYGVEAKGK